MRLGFTGHRPNRLVIGTDAVDRLVGSVIDDIVAAVHRRDAYEAIVAISSLAEGADRLFADAALARGLTLAALLPFDRWSYEQTFGDATTTAHYRDLLTRAMVVTELPGSLADTTAAYEAVGHAMTDGANMLVAVWDGKPAAGRGGTTEIIDYALAKGRPVVWIDASHERAPVRLAIDGSQSPLAATDYDALIAATLAV